MGHEVLLIYMNNIGNNNLAVIKDISFYESHRGELLDLHKFMFFVSSALSFCC